MTTMMMMMMTTTTMMTGSVRMSVPIDLPGTGLSPYLMVTWYTPGSVGL